MVSWFKYGLASLAALVLFKAGVARAQEIFALKEAPFHHAETITQSRQAYNVRVGGTLDEFNTADFKPTYGGSMRQEPRFQPNQYLELENAGETDVIAPRVVIGGRRNWFSAADILAGVIRPGMSDEEKAMALQAFLGSHDVQAHDNNRRPGPPQPDMGGMPSRNAFKERANPVLALNCFYCGGCQFGASNYVILAREAGLTARAGWINSLDSYNGHCIAEVWYGGGWHLFDPDQRVYYRDADNLSIASCKTLHDHPDLAARVTDCGFAKEKPGNSYATRYALFDPPHVMPVDAWLSVMDMTLRPGERFIWRWTHDGKFYCGDNVRSKGAVPHNLANGMLVWRPRLDAPAFWHGALAGITVAPAGEGKTAHLQPEITSATARVIYKIASPYPIVGARAAARFNGRTAADACAMYVAARGSDWIKVWEAAGPGEGSALVRLDEALAPGKAPMLTKYTVKFEMRAQERPGDAWLSDICFETDVQLSMMALPSLAAGDNEVVYTDRSPAGRRVRLTHGWAESSATRPPEAPRRALAPADGQSINMAELKTLRWEPARDPDAEAMSAYHVQVSPRADMLLPVCNNLDRLVKKGDAEWPVPEGFLAKGHEYYWRVRARDAWGAWSPWSPIWNFTVR